MKKAISLMTIPELKKLAKSMKLKGYSKLKKQELINLIHNKGEKTPKKTTPPKILNKDVFGIIMEYAKEDKINKDRRKQIKYAKENLKKHLKKKSELAQYSRDQINAYNRKLRELIALNKTRDQLQEAPVKELREWVKVLKVGKITGTKKSEILKMVNKTLDDLDM
jgi:hypothetical protein